MKVFVLSVVSVCSNNALHRIKMLKTVLLQERHGIMIMIELLVSYVMTKRRNLYEAVTL